MSGTPWFDQIHHTAPTAVEVTAGGAITITQSLHTVTDAGGPGAAADILDTITKADAADGDLLQLRLTAAGSRITIDGVLGNIRTPGAKRFSLAAADDLATFRFSAANNRWMLLGIETAADSLESIINAAPADSAAVVNPGVETAFDVTATVLGNTLEPGTVIKIKAKVRKTSQGAIDQSVYSVRFAGVTISAHTQSAAATALMIIEAEITIRTIGGAGTFESVVKTSESPLVGGAQAAVTLDEVHDGAIDTSIDRTIDVTVTRSDNDGGNSSQLEMLNVSRG